MRSVLCYGDSNTHGTPTVPRPDGRYGPAERWPGVLRAALGADWLVIEEGLGGRTTVSTDPVEFDPDKNGARFLPVALHTHKPLDAVVIMLGTNDLKARFGKSAWEIAQGAGVLVDLVKRSACGPNESVPEVLLVCPPVVLDHLPSHADMFAGAPAKSRDMARHYQAVAGDRSVHFLDAGTIIRSSAFDGFHLDPEAHGVLGRAIATEIGKWHFAA